MTHYKCRTGVVWSLLLAAAVTLALKNYELSIDAIPPLLEPAPAAAAINTVPRTEVVENTIQKNATLLATLVDYEVPLAIANEVVDIVKPVFNLRKLRSGNSFRLEKETDGTLKKFEYNIDEESVLKVEKGDEAYAASVEKLELETREIAISAEIRTSLWNSLEDVPKREFLASELAEMFQWQVDFSNEIYPGDQIHLVVEELFNGENFVKYGKIQTAELINAGRRYRGFLFKGSYYDEKGVSLKRAMLASPLKFTPRVSSGFTYRRMHPILGSARAHLATDYAAPTGSPVVAVANGTVTFAGWDGGYGNLVRIKHSNGLTSGYAHLSRIGSGIRKGASVKQSDVVGLVGQTGLATGPHLHFMMTKNGTPINPVPALKKGEPSPPLVGGLKVEFAQWIEPMQIKLSEIEPSSQTLKAAR